MSSRSGPLRREGTGKQTRRRRFPFGRKLTVLILFAALILTVFFGGVIRGLW